MTDIQASIKNRFIAMRLDGENPCWSSHVLDEVFQEALGIGNESVNDIFVPVFSLLNGTRLSEQRANFIKEIAVIAFSKYRDSYDQSALEWIGEGILNTCCESQAFFALYAIPPDSMTAEHVVRILNKLSSSDFWMEAVANLEEEATKPEVKLALRRWLSEGVSDDCQEDIQRMIGH